MPLYSLPCSTHTEQLQRFKKLSYRISFPLELKLTNTSDQTDNPDRLYTLFAVVVHVGSGPNHGHYISLVRSHTHWLLFDDESVELIEEANIHSCFGSSVDTAANTDTGCGGRPTPRRPPPAARPHALSMLSCPL